MIDISKLKYIVILITETGEKLYITSAAEDLDWEEGDGELATRITFTIGNIKYKGKRLSGIAKLGCTVIIMSNWGGKNHEVARGKIHDWKPTHSDKRIVEITAYDELYDIEQSQDNRYFPSGIGTKAAITSIFNDWKIPLAKYDGPNVRHGKMTFKDEALGDILSHILNDAEKRGSDKHIIRASKGKVYIIPRGSNTDIYHFASDTNTTVVEDEMSTADLVTRVKVIGKTKKKGKEHIVAVVNGDTKYGIKQQIVSKSSSDTLATAKKEAEKIIKEKGRPKHTISLESPDIPVIRKGDKIHATAGSLNGYYYTKSVRHDATSRTMTMELKAV
jgi:hypothetical protein